MPYTSVKGMNDILPPQSFLWAEIEKIVHPIFKSFGFSPVMTPVVEKSELFSRSIGAACDIVEKQMYVFKDEGDDEFLALRPEGTASVVRAYIEHHLAKENPYRKLYYWGTMYRHEKMQKGRSREFHQFGAEVFGSSSPRTDAETIFMLVSILKALGVKNFEVQLNSLGCKECRPEYRKDLISFFQKKRPELCQDCQKRLEKNPLRILDCKNEGCRKTAKQAPKVLDHLCQGCEEHFKLVQSALTQLKVSFVLNPNIVRGLDYYVRTAFEIISSDLGAQNALGAGGRYDGLVEELGGENIPAFGFAFGVERLALILDNERKFKDVLNLFVAALGEKAQSFSFELVNELRLKGIRTEMDYEDRPLKYQMKKADRLNAAFVLILGDDEFSKGHAILRNMETKEQKSIPLDRLWPILEKEIQP